MRRTGLFAKYLVLTAAISVLSVVLVNILISLGFLEGASSVVAPISNFIDNNKYIFIFWHIILYFAIFKGLEMYANHMIINNKLSKANKDDAIKFCYLAVFVVIVTDFLFYVGRAL